MIQLRDIQKSLLGTAGMTLLLAGAPTIATADAPCGDLAECRVLIEINASDGDIGFHVLFDAEGWQQARITDPNGKKIFKEQADGGLREQKLTENFFESAEPVCEPALAEDPEDEVVTLPEFLARFPAGSYGFHVRLGSVEQLSGATELSHNLPAAPAEVDFDGSRISWSYGTDLGECTTVPAGFAVAEETDIAAYEAVLVPDDDALGAFKFSVLVPSDVNSVSVPTEFLDSLPAGTPLKVEVGAIEERQNGSLGNQTFSEEVGFCNSADGVCPEAVE